MDKPRLLGLSAFIRSILGRMSFQLRERSFANAEPQVYQPPVVPKQSFPPAPPPSP